MTTNQILFIVCSAAILAVMATALQHQYSRIKKLAAKAEAGADAKKSENMPSVQGLEFLSDPMIRVVRMSNISVDTKYTLSIMIEYKGNNIWKEFNHDNPNVMFEEARAWFVNNKEKLKEFSEL